MDDIDLFPGLIMEEAFEDAQIGETFVCLISDTFARLRFGDRFFYDNGGQAGSFTLPQLDQVRAQFRHHSRFFVQVGHETTYASSGNKHFFTK